MSGEHTPAGAAAGSESKSGPGEPGVEDDAFWYEYLTQGDPQERALRRVFAHLPASPRCKACAAPFGGLGG